MLSKMIASVPLLLLIAQVHSTYYVVEDDAKQKPCKLAAPIIMDYKPGDETKRLVVDVVDNLNVTDNKWLRVGYVRLYGTFDFVGCSDVDTLPYQQEFKIDSEQIGLCYSACNTIYFGIYGDTCYCLDDIPMDRAPLNCKSPCRLSEDGLCKEFGQFISIYKYANDVKTESEAFGEDMCRLFNSASMTYSWSKCRDFNRGLCMNGTASRVVNDSYWDKYLDECLSRHTFPATDIMTTIPRNVIPVWLGQKMSKVITKRMDACEDLTQLCVQGYIYREKSTFYLHFQTSNSQSKTLCEKENGIPPTAAASTIGLALGGCAVVALVVSVVLIFWFRRWRSQCQWTVADSSLQEMTSGIRTIHTNPNYDADAAGDLLERPRQNVTLKDSYVNCEFKGRHGKSTIDSIRNVPGTVDVTTGIKGSYDDIYNHTFEECQLQDKTDDTYDHLNM